MPGSRHGAPSFRACAWLRVPTYVCVPSFSVSFSSYVPGELVDAISDCVLIHKVTLRSLSILISLRGRNFHYLRHTSPVFLCPSRLSPSFHFSIAWQRYHFGINTWIGVLVIALDGVLDGALHGALFEAYESPYLFLIAVSIYISRR